MADKDLRKQAELQFAGQGTEEARAAVKLQRELKKKKDALRKVEKKLKAANAGDAEHTAMEQELQEIKAAIAELEGSSPARDEVAGAGSASPSPCNPSITVATSTAAGSSPTPKHNTAAAEDDDAARKQKKELQKLSEVHFMGQTSEEAKAAVKKQRELKKKRDALRKVQKKLKSMKPEDEAFAATKEEEAGLEREISELEGGDGHSATTAAVPAPTPPTAVATAKGKASAPAVAAEAAKAAEERNPEVEDVEGNAAKLRLMVERAMRESRGSLTSRLRESIVHPRIAEVTVMMEEMLIVGGNARALAMIAAFREMFKTTTILSGSSLQDIDTQAFTELVERNFAFMRRKREANAGMRYVKEAVVRRLIAVRDEMVQQKHRSSIVESGGNAVGASLRHNSVLESFPGDAREVALQMLDMIDSEIRMSVKSIVEERSLPYVSSSDTILVFGRSSVVEFILLSRIRNAHRKPKKVLVIDSAPLYEGRELAHKLSEAGINVTYGLITAACTLMPKCTRVFIGASSVLQNGDVFGRCGTALVAACAKTFRKPVLCFAESYKFVSEVWLGNLAQNTKLMDIKEAPAPHEGSIHSPLAYTTPPSFAPLQPPQSALNFGGFGVGNSGNTWGKGGGEFTPPLFSSGGPTTVTTPLPNMGSTASSSAASGYLYDLTPAAYVDMIICEMGCLHTSAIIAAIKDREGRDASPAMVFNAKN